MLEGMRQVVASAIVIGVIAVLMRVGWWQKVAVGVEAVGWPVRWISRQVASSVWQVADSLRFIKSGVKRVENLEREKAGLLVETEELARLRQLVGMEVLSQLNTVALGRVVGKVGDEMLIDRGQREGVKVGMIAGTEESILVGRVVTVGRWMSRVRLVSSLDEKVAVVGGVSRGAGGDRLWLEQVLQGVVLAAGARVISSGGDGVYPSGWLVGTVGEVVTGDGEVYQRAEIKRAFAGRYGDMVVIGD